MPNRPKKFRILFQKKKKKSIYFRRTHLEEAYEIGEDEPVDVRQRVYERDGGRRVVAVVDGAVVHRRWDERLMQLAVPQLEQRRRHVRVGAAARRVEPLVAARLQRVHLVDVARDPATTRKFNFTFFFGFFLSAVYSM